MRVVLTKLRILNGLPNFRLYWKTFFRATDETNRNRSFYKFFCAMRTRALKYKLLQKCVGLIIQLDKLNKAKTKEK